MNRAVEDYLKEMHDIRSTGGGVEETSYYGPLSNLLNEVGKTLRPKVKCVSQLKNTGAGNPDFGLYTANQFRKSKDSDPLPGQLPERGVIEAKSVNDDSWVTAESKQVSKYWQRYGHVIVTNYRDFVHLGRDDEQNPVVLETFRLADDEKSFWSATLHAHKTANDKGEEFVEYLQRVMQYTAAVKNPSDLAKFLASYARQAQKRIEAVKDLPGLALLRKGLEDALGMKFEGENGEHFFRATLVQTLFYGVFSSWVLWARNHRGKHDATFDWKTAAWDLHVPMIASLFEQIATPKQLKPLGIDEVLDWTGKVLNRVDRREFFRQFEEEHAVQYFYEPFLEAYDPELRKELGVWYTPPEIVKYQVERVDTVLREELDITDGLADKNVVVLDPCCGTGAYLVEVLRKIHRTLESKGGDAMTAAQLKEAAMRRIFGFEILPAPFVISHLQLGLLLRELGAPLSDKRSERAGVYLTNALTGWEPPKKPKDALPFPELQEEKDAAEKVKREAPILVILGNPPYNAFAGTSPEEEGDLVEAYKGLYISEKKTRKGKTSVRKYKLSDPISKGGWGIRKYNLDELYVRFFRIAERRIVTSGKGVICYISNFSYLDKDSFVIMRDNLSNEFDSLWFDCMNGDSRETGKLTPEGMPDPSVFSTEYNRAGIRKGTAVSLMVRQQKRKTKPIIRFKHFWGTEKRKDLLKSLNLKDINRSYKELQPLRKNKFLFKPSKISENYSLWCPLQEVSNIPAITGYKENRGFSLIDSDCDVLAERLKLYFDENCSWKEFQKIKSGLSRNAARFDAEKTRGKVTLVESFDNERIQRYLLRPFENKWCYYCTVRPLWNEPRPSLYEHHKDSNAYVTTRPSGVADPEGTPFLFSRSMIDFDCIKGHSYNFPITLFTRKKKSKHDDGMTGDMFGQSGEAEEIKANLSERARGYLKGLGFANPDTHKDVAELIWMHSLAIGYSRAYLAENADGIRQDWPRIPLPENKKTLLSSAALGRRVAALLDTEAAVGGVTTGAIEKELAAIGLISKVGSGAVNPDTGELDVTAGWGHEGKGGVCMPGKGKLVTRPFLEDEVKALSGAQRAMLGGQTCDVYLNEKVYIRNVPQAVWEYYIGGYQVIKKWLSYREKSMLGRGLKMEEALYLREMVRRVTALVLMGPELDGNYEAVKQAVFVWET